MGEGVSVKWNECKTKGTTGRKRRPQKINMFEGYYSWGNVEKSYAEQKSQHLIKHWNLENTGLRI